MNKKHIPIYLLESFVMASKCPSFQLAANELQITQSTLSKQMLLLESMLPYKLFTFDGRKKVLTNYGKSLFNSLEVSFSQTQIIVSDVAREFDVIEDVNISVAGRGELLDIVAVESSFKGRISFFPSKNSDAINKLLAREVDLAIVHSAPSTHELVLRPFLTNTFKLVLSKNSFNRKPVLNNFLVRKLLELPVLLYKYDDEVFSHFCNDWSIEKSELKISRVYPHYSTLAKMIDDGKSWAILPSHIKVDEAAYEIPLNFNSKSQVKFHFCYRRETSKLPWFIEFMNSLEKI